MLNNHSHLNCKSFQATYSRGLTTSSCWRGSTSWSRPWTVTRHAQQQTTWDSDPFTKETQE